MRFCLAVLGVLLVTLGAIPASSSPVYVHAKTRKAKKHKVPRHRTVQE
jgi:hypothetical protein